MLPKMPTITATAVTAPPSWALLERKLIALMEDGVHMMSRKYAERSGAWYWSDDLDDYYERSYNWCLLYNMGGDESLVDLALKHWNATTRLFDDRAKNRANNLDYHHGVTPMKLKHNIHNEYFSIAHPGDAEWHHMGEGNMAFYDLALGDPTIYENVRRARRFAGMYLGEDPESPTCRVAAPPHPAGGLSRWVCARRSTRLSRSWSLTGGRIRSERTISLACSTSWSWTAILPRTWPPPAW